MIDKISCYNGSPDRYQPHKTKLWRGFIPLFRGLGMIRQLS